MKILSVVFVGLIFLTGFKQVESKTCTVADCSEDACYSDNECLIDTPEGLTCSTRRWIKVNERSRFWVEDDIITCPINDIDPT